jgi:hypothetical protein
MLTEHQQHVRKVIEHLEEFTHGDPGMAMAGGIDNARFTPPTIEQEREILADLEELNRLYEIRVLIPDAADRQSLLALRKKYGFPQPE